MILRCINPTKTLTMGKLYEGTLLKYGRYEFLHTENLGDAVLFIIFNSDNGKKVSVSSKRFQLQ